ncbi:hypothetical protein OIU77_002246 [Salix suchowensis]|uniref:Uncharacterized protein n=1 Tax=Salix suchowensis TaxID=1278906 RepID=A0ABQ9B4A2_9ROSI|nr:hypothetical protein OIU77_002246 [Salix suchowensis]
MDHSMYELATFLQNDAVLIKNLRPHMMLSMPGSMRWDWPWIVRWECVLGRNDILKKKNSREPLAQAQGRVVNQWSKKEILLFNNLCTCLCGILEFFEINFIIIIMIIIKKNFIIYNIIIIRDFN